MAKPTKKQAIDELVHIAASYIQDWFVTRSIVHWERETEDKIKDDSERAELAFNRINYLKAVIFDDEA